MATRFDRLWVISCVLMLALVSPAQATGRTINISGQVAFGNGSPVEGGIVIIQELYGKIGEMPDVRYVAVRSTNRDGFFEADVENVKGALHVELVPDRCDWSSDYFTLTADMLRAHQDQKIELRPGRERCAGRGEKNNP